MTQQMSAAKQNKRVRIRTIGLTRCLSNLFPGGARRKTGRGGSGKKKRRRFFSVPLWYLRFIEFFDILQIFQHGIVHGGVNFVFAVFILL